MTPTTGTDPAGGTAAGGPGSGAGAPEGPVTSGGRGRWSARARRVR